MMVLKHIWGAKPGGCTSVISTQIKVGRLQLLDQTGLYNKILPQKQNGQKKIGFWSMSHFVILS
jgi:hypothetical protein